MLQSGNERNIMKINIMKINPSIRRIQEGASVSLRIVACIVAITVSHALPSYGSSAQLLYVVDTDHQDQNHKAQILVVDPQQNKVVNAIRAGYHPDFAISQDGKRIYLS